MVGLAINPFYGCAPYVSDAKYAFPDKGSELFFFLYIQVFPILLMFRQENWKKRVHNSSSDISFSSFITDMVD